MTEGMAIRMKGTAAEQARYEADFAEAVRAVVRPAELLAIDERINADPSAWLVHQHYLLSASVSRFALAAAWA